MTPLPLSSAMRETIEAVITPPSSSRSSASACACAEGPPVAVVTDTKPSPSTIPSGVLAGIDRDVPSLPDALHERHAAEIAGDHGGRGAH